MTTTQPTAERRTMDVDVACVGYGVSGGIGVQAAILELDLAPADQPKPVVGA